MTSPASNIFAILNLESDCPICFEPFHPPVYQCTNGHLICCACEPKCKLCAVCREPMPGRKIRNIAFEKMVTALDTEASPCPQQDLGCTEMLKKSQVADHKLECGFINKKFCSQLGLYCSMVNSTSKLNEMITHFIFDHKMDGSIGDDVDFADSKLELVQSCKRTDLNQYMALKWTIPNFINYDGKIFFIKKKVNVTGETACLMVCMEASLKTASKYSAFIQLLPGPSNSSVILPLEFKQSKIALLTTAFPFEANENKKSNHSLYCKIPFKAIENFGKPDDIRRKDLCWKLSVKIIDNFDNNKNQELTPTSVLSLANSGTNAINGSVLIPAVTDFDNVATATTGSHPRSVRSSALLRARRRLRRSYSRIQSSRVQIFEVGRRQGHEQSEIMNMAFNAGRP